MNTAVDLLTELRRVRPCPADEYGEAYWNQEMQYLLTEASALLAGRHRELLAVIHSEDLRSPEFRIETPFTPVRRVDIPLLRQELPAVFGAIVYLKATDAERLLSRRRLYDLSCEAAGIDRVRPLEQINLGDLAKILPKEEFSRFVLVTQKPLPAQIVRIAEEA